MPTYSYICNNCSAEFELFSYIKNYETHPKCTHCESSLTERLIVKDAITQISSVKKSDSELKTLGDLAQRNTDRMSDDYKQHLYMKHNSYKDKEDLKPLPNGMSRMEKGTKIKWPGTNNTKVKRKTKNG